MVLMVDIFSVLVSYRQRQVLDCRPHSNKES
jgi:hypothetical protein